MTTKRFLLDLLDAAEEAMRKKYTDRVDSCDPTERFAISAYYNPKLCFVERARRLVEKGTDEP